jgi:hypothetical protein
VHIIVTESLSGERMVMVLSEELGIVRVQISLAEVLKDE